MKVTEVVLSNGVHMPNIAYGTWRLNDNVTDIIKSVLDIGYRHLDTAYSYGNDFFVGKAIKQSGIPRDQLFITNKVWNSFRGKEATVSACKKSLKLMKLDYFDLYLIHWPEPISNPNWIEINLDTWFGMESLYNEGLVRAIGVSNFLPHHLKMLLDKGLSVTPMVNQIEFHPGKNQEELLFWCKQNNIIVEGWSPLGNGEVVSNPLIVELSEKYDCSPAQLCLQWEMQKGVVPIPRSTNLKRIDENLRIPTFSINDSDTRLIDRLRNIGCSPFVPDINQPNY